MPNLIPPVATTKDAIAYRERVMAALPAGSTFKPLMTCYLTDDTDPDDVERGFKDGVFTGVKLYPANATTNSAAGVTDYRKIMRVLERMEKIGMPFLMHGEDVDPEIDIFDREADVHRALSVQVDAAFPRPALHPGAPVVEGRRRFRAERGAAGRRHHHALSPDPDAHGLAGLGAQALYVLHAGDQDGEGPRGAAQGRDLGRGLLFPRHGFRAASGGEEAVGERHPGPVQCPGRDRDLRQGVRGGRRARQARSLCLAQRPEALPPAAERGTITLEKSPWTAPEEVKVDGPDEKALVYRGGETIEWKVVQVDSAALSRAWHRGHWSVLPRR